MKKVLSIIAIAAMSTAFVACGPSKEELEAKAKKVQDSIEAVEKMAQEEAAKAEAEKAAAEAAAAAEKAKQDSIHMADSLAKVKPGKKH